MVTMAVAVAVAVVVPAAAACSRQWSTRPALRTRQPSAELHQRRGARRAIGYGGWLVDEFTLYGACLLHQSQCGLGFIEDRVLCAVLVLNCAAGFMWLPPSPLPASSFRSWPPQWKKPSSPNEPPQRPLTSRSPAACPRPWEASPGVAVAVVAAPTPPGHRD